MTPPAPDEDDPTGSGDPSLPERCEREIRGLHGFFEAWFTGRVDHRKSEFARVEDALATDFVLVDPSGERRERDSLLTAIADAHGSTPDLEIETTPFEPRYVDRGVCLGTYEEHQTDEEGATRRVSTVLFRADEAAPEGVSWHHLHETWVGESN